MAKRRKTTKKSATKRKKRAWTRVTFDELDEWRANRGIPKKKMAEMLGVTNSTYHNWARGIAVATPSTQERIREFLDRGGRNGARNHHKPGESHVMAATGQIVASYLEAKQGSLSEDKLIRLVREVKRALQS